MFKIKIDDLHRKAQFEVYDHITDKYHLKAYASVV